MSSLFDDLARTLAKPMPRGGALRAIGAVLAVGAVPALRPNGALGHAGRTQACTGPTKRCFVAIPFGTHEGGCYYPDYDKCCKGPNNDAEHPNQMSWICPKDTECGSAATKFCTCSNTCKDGKCCPKSKGRCVKGTCCPLKRTTFAPGTKGKGVACCPPGTVAVPGGTGLCCPPGDKDCCDKYDQRKDDDELSNLGLKKGTLCVKGKARKA